MGEFIVEPSVPERILSIRIEGSLSLDDVKRLRSTQLSAIALVGWQARDYGLLVDITDSKIQGAAVASALDALRTDPSLAPRCMAFIHGASAAKIQVRRLAAIRGDGVFASRADALAWLEMK